jgi:hypothetical protein
MLCLHVLVSGPVSSKANAPFLFFLFFAAWCFHFFLVRVWYLLPVWWRVWHVTDSVMMTAFSFAMRAWSKRSYKYSPLSIPHPFLSICIFSFTLLNYSPRSISWTVLYMHVLFSLSLSLTHTQKKSEAHVSVLVVNCPCLWSSLGVVLCRCDVSLRLYFFGIMLWMVADKT